MKGDIFSGGVNSRKIKKRGERWTHWKREKKGKEREGRRRPPGKKGGGVVERKENRWREVES